MSSFLVESSKREAFEDDTLTIGELVRWVNSEIIKLAKGDEYDKAKNLAILTDSVEVLRQSYYSK